MPVDEDDERIIRGFLDEVSEVQRRLKQTVRAPKSIDRNTRKPTRLPAKLPAVDNRFAVKSARVFCCDGCGNIVRF